MLEYHWQLKQFYKIIIKNINYIQEKSKRKEQNQQEIFNPRPATVFDIRKRMENDKKVVNRKEVTKEKRRNKRKETKGQ